VNSIMIQEGNATDHLTADDQALLNQVIGVIRNSMYASMTSAHQCDENSLAEAIAAINQCYGDFAARVADDGDITGMHNSATSYQVALDALQDDVDEKTLANNTAWNNLQIHISLISDAPHCPALPNPRTMAALDVYFDSSAYVTWWTAQKAAYEPVRDAFVYADQQLRAAITAYAVGLAVRDVAYCDWKRELEAACEQFSQCYEEKKAHYLNVVKPAVEEDMRMRIEAYKAGETIIHQIRFLLAEEADQATPAINTDVYQIAFPEVPAKLACDMSALDDAAWVPTPDCTSCDENVNIGHRQDGYRGCQDHSRNGNVCENWITARNNWARIVDGESERFPDKGLGDHNFCRNPDHEPEGIWCWTATTWEYCNPVSIVQTPPPPTQPTAIVMGLQVAPPQVTHCTEHCTQTMDATGQAGPRECHVECTTN